ncbi:enoyl-CoA hydratase/isomerase family protein [Leifsonia kafniensis]|uniref:enoyl-CoA hydratase/isomerase family protein n=1 Tax=Leifsonia kafniensis TaxID=475957 RepID=UPI0031E756AA
MRWLHLSRPAQRNALNGEIAEALARQVEDIEADDRTSVVVVAGDGPSFCAGGDFRHFLRLHEEGGVVPFLAELSRCFTMIEASSKVWVAALHGHAIAGGLELALVCDVVIAAEGTLIGDGHLNNALLPGAGSSVRLERAVGKGTARWLHLTGDTVPAEQLKDTGWLHTVVPAEYLHEEADRVARHLARQNLPTQRRMKQLLVAVASVDTGAGLARELEFFGDNWASENVAGALRGFLDRRALSS